MEKSSYVEEKNTFADTLATVVQVATENNERVLSLLGIAGQGNKVDMTRY